MILINGKPKTDFKRLTKQKIYNLSSNYIAYRRVEHRGKVFEVKQAPKLFGLANRYIRFNPETNAREEIIYYTREIPIPGDPNGRTMHTVDGRPEIYFMEGMLRVNEHEPDLAWFLDNDPANASNENRDKRTTSKFFEVDRDKIDEKRYQEGLKMNEAFEHIYSKLTLPQLREICASYGEPNAYELTMMQARSRLSNWVQRVEVGKGGGPDIFLEKLKNPLLPYFLIVRTAIDKRIVTMNHATRMWEWGYNGQPIINVPAGTDAELKLVNYVYDNTDGIKEEIEQRIGKTREPVFSESQYSVDVKPEKPKKSSGGIQNWHELQRAFKDGMAAAEDGNIEEAIKLLQKSLDLNDGSTEKKKGMKAEAYAKIQELTVASE